MPSQRLALEEALKKGKRLHGLVIRHHVTRPLDGSIDKVLVLLSKTGHLVAHSPRPPRALWREVKRVNPRLGARVGHAQVLVTAEDERPHALRRELGVDRNHRLGVEVAAVLNRRAAHGPLANVRDGRRVDCAAHDIGVDVVDEARRVNAGRRPAKALGRKGRKDRRREHMRVRRRLRLLELVPEDVVHAEPRCNGVGVRGELAAGGRRLRIRAAAFLVDLREEVVADDAVPVQERVGGLGVQLHVRAAVAHKIPLDVDLRRAAHRVAVNNRLRESGHVDAGVRLSRDVEIVGKVLRILREEGEKGRVVVACRGRVVRVVIGRVRRVRETHASGSLEIEDIRNLVPRVRVQVKLLLSATGTVNKAEGSVLVKHSVE
eukprot:Opistho-1_new@37892